MELFSLKHLLTVQLPLLLSLHSGLFGQISSTNSKIIFEKLRKQPSPFIKEYCT